MVGIAERRERLDFELKEGLIDKGWIDPLAEVRLMIGALEAESRGERRVYEENLAYVKGNEFTRLIEAVTDGFLFVSFQNWDNGQFKAFGKGLQGLYLARVARLEELCQFNSELSWELERNRIELGEEIDWMEAQQRGLLNEYMGVVISPYPDGVNPRLARSFGYKPDTRQTMIRGVQVNSEGRRVMEQVGVVWGKEFSMRVFTKLLRRLGIVGSKIESTAQVLESRVLVSREICPGGIVDVVRMYDEVLSEESGGQKQFFCGREVGSEEDRCYERLAAEREVIEEKVGKFVDRLLELDRGLANLFMGKGEVEESMVVKVAREAAEARKGDGGLVLDGNRRDLILQFLTTGHLTDEVAALLKQFEFLRVASATIALVNEEEARRKLGDVWVDRIRRGIDEGGWDNDEWRMMVTRMVGETQPTFSFCGGMAGLDGGLYPTWQNILTEASEGGFNCPNCGGFIRQGSGDVCPHCGYTKQEHAAKTGIECG